MANDNKNKTTGDGAVAPEPQQGAAASAPAGNTGVRADAAPSESAKQVRKVKFAVEQKSPTLEIGHGEYSRKFIADDQPFEVGDEEFTMLIGTGHFVEA